MLRSLERQGLVRVETGHADRRVRFVHPTAAGMAERAELDRRSDEVARGFLEPLGERQRGRLVAAMTEVERLLTASAVRLAVENPTTADARWCIEQYFAELNALLVPMAEVRSCVGEKIAIQALGRVLDTQTTDADLVEYLTRPEADQVPSFREILLRLARSKAFLTVTHRGDAP